MAISNNKTDELNAAIGNGRPERLSLAASRDIAFEQFYTNLRILTGSETCSMVDLSKKLGLRSGARITNLCYGKGNPSSEELIILSSYFKCTIDDLLNRKATIIFTD